MLAYKNSCRHRYDYPCYSEEETETERLSGSSKIKKAVPRKTSICSLNKYLLVHYYMLGSMVTVMNKSSIASV